VLTCCDAAQAGPPRVAYAIGRRTGNAVERNRIRRRLRPIVAAHAERLLPDCQYLIGAKPAALRESQLELTNTLLDLLERAHEARR
jgi:ribonuclease P protein component